MIGDPLSTMIPAPIQKSAQTLPLIKQFEIVGLIPSAIYMPPPALSKAVEDHTIPFPFVTVNPFNFPDVELPVEKIITALLVVPFMIVLLIVKVSLVVM